MKKLVVFISAAALLMLSAAAWGIADDGENSFGLYWTGAKTAPTQTELDEATICPQQPFYLRRPGIHMVIANPSATQVSGFEMGFSVVSDNPYFEVRGYINEPTTYLDFGTSELDYAVGFSTPQNVVGNWFYLGALEVDVDDVTSTDSVQIFGCPGASPSVPLTAVYTAASAAVKVPMNWATGAADELTGCSPAPLMWLNCTEPPVANEDATWSSVKDLYR